MKNKKANSKHIYKKEKGQYNQNLLQTVVE